MAPPHTLGIDLGTTCSCVAYWLNKQTHVIPEYNGTATVASCVCYTGDPEMGNLVGNQAKAESLNYHSSTIMDVKRMLGRRFDDPKITERLQSWPFPVHENERGLIKIRVPSLEGGSEDSVSPEEVSSLVLEALVDSAQQKFGARPTSAVITVPAYFNDAQRKATRDAADLARLQVVRLINEPTAAAVAYALDAPKPEKRQVLVFDLGGGTFDISLLQMEGYHASTLATTGNDQLGGYDFDQRLTDWLLAELQAERPDVDCQQGGMTASRVRARAEDVKVAINQEGRPGQQLFQLPQVAPGHRFRRVVTLAKFNELCEDLFQLCFRGSEAGLGGLDELFGAGATGGRHNREDVAEVLLVGGSTNLLRIRALLGDYFGKEKLNLAYNGAEAVARGAAAVAAIVGGEAEGDFRCSEDGPQISKPDPPTFKDVSSHSIGVALGSGAFDCILSKNTELPASTTRTNYTTHVLGSTATTIKIFEGENPVASLNNLLGTVSLSDIKVPKSGKPKLQVKMSLDESGALKVTAQDITDGSQGGRPVSANFTSLPGRLSAEEIDHIKATRDVQRQQQAAECAASNLDVQD